MVAKIAIGDYPMASGDCLVPLIAKLARVYLVLVVGNGRLVKGMLLAKLYYAGTRPVYLIPTIVLLQT